MNKVQIEECGLESEGRKCRQDPNRILVGLRMRVRPQHAAGFSGMKAFSFEDADNVVIEKAWLDRLRNGEGHCPFCETPCRLETVERQRVSTPVERVESFDQAFRKLFNT